MIYTDRKKPYVRKVTEYRKPSGRVNRYDVNVVQQLLDASGTKYDVHTITYKCSDEWELSFKSHETPWDGELPEDGPEVCERARSIARGEVESRLELNRSRVEDDGE